MSASRAAHARSSRPSPRRLTVRPPARRRARRRVLVSPRRLGAAQRQAARRAAPARRRPPAGRASQRPRAALLALAQQTLDLPALGGELALQLGRPDGQRALKPAPRAATRSATRCGARPRPPRSAALAFAQRRVGVRAPLFVTPCSCAGSARRMPVPSPSSARPGRPARPGASRRHARCAAQARAHSRPRRAGAPRPQPRRTTRGHPASRRSRQSLGRGSSAGARPPRRLPSRRPAAQHLRSGPADEGRSGPLGSTLRRAVEFPRRRIACAGPVPPASAIPPSGPTPSSRDSACLRRPPTTAASAGRPKRRRQRQLRSRRPLADPRSATPRRAVERRLRRRPRA